MGFIMNLGVMAADWRTEGRQVIKKNLNESLRRGSYSEASIKSFLNDVNVKGLDKNEAGRRNSIPKGSVYHIYNVYNGEY